MKKLGIRLLRLIILLPTIILIPIWILLWLFTGIDMASRILEFSVHGTTFKEQEELREKVKVWTQQAKDREKLRKG